MYNKIKIEKKENIAILTITRPESLNALGLEVLSEIENFIHCISSEKVADGLIITGEGRAFIAGADIREQVNLTIDEAVKWSCYGAGIFRKIETLNIPTLAAVNGFALGGGCELAMACDFRIASEKAVFGFPEVSLGVIPGYSGMHRLTELIGKSRALELIMTARKIDANEAKEIGLIHKCVPQDRLLLESVNFMKSVLVNGPYAIKYAKIAVNRGREMTLDNAMILDAHLFSLCYATNEAQEGMTAFLEKREPDFKR